MIMVVTMKNPVFLCDDQSHTIALLFALASRAEEDYPMAFVIKGEKLIS
jgi:hypothetical protein